MNQKNISLFFLFFLSLLLHGNFECTMNEHYKEHSVAKTDLALNKSIAKKNYKKEVSEMMTLMKQAADEKIFAFTPICFYAGL